MPFPKSCLNPVCCLFPQQKPIYFGSHAAGVTRLICTFFRQYCSTLCQNITRSINEKALNSKAIDFIPLNPFLWTLDSPRTTTTTNKLVIALTFQGSCNILLCAIYFAKTRFQVCEANSCTQHFSRVHLRYTVNTWTSERFIAVLMQTIIGKHSVTWQLCIRNNSKWSTVNDPQWASGKPEIGNQAIYWHFYFIDLIKIIQISGM